MSPNPLAYRAAQTGVARADRSDRVRFRIAGPDRVKFLNNLTTNDVKRLAPGQGCEAFVTSLQGKTLGYLAVMALGDAFLVRTDPGGLDTLLPHFEKYGVFDDVAWDDLSGGTFEEHLVGPFARELLGGHLDPAVARGNLGHAEIDLGGARVRVVGEAPTGRPGFTLIGPRPVSGVVAEALAALWADLADDLRPPEAPTGLLRLDAATFDALRIEAGTPVAGRDVTPENLPQEVGRDRLAISFIKGCYLGQETVARLDALGHVNKLLRGLLLDPGPVPPPGTTLEAGGKVVGTMTSTSFSPGWDRPIALAYVRVAQAGPGTMLGFTSEGSPRSATVAELPMIPG